MTNEERVNVVSAAWDAGVRYVDTAPFYGVGAAERAVGDALRDRPRDEWVLSTKVGRLLRPHDSGGQTSRRQIRAAAVRGAIRLLLRRHHALDGGQLSAPRAWPRSTSCSCTTSASISTAREANAAHMKVLRESGYRALEELRRTGVVSAIGLGVNEKEVLIEVLELRRLGRVPARRTLHAAGAGTAR